MILQRRATGGTRNSRPLPSSPDCWQFPGWPTACTTSMNSTPPSVWSTSALTRRTLSTYCWNPTPSANTCRPWTCPLYCLCKGCPGTDPQRLAQLTGAGWFRDGLTDGEAAIVATLYGRSRFQSPEFDAIVADPDILTVAMSTTTNRAGQTVPVVILRSGPAPGGSPVMLGRANSPCLSLSRCLTRPCPRRPS